MLNITDEQMDILRTIYALGQNSEFVGLFTHSGSSLLCGSSPAVPISVDKSDFRQLAKEDLVTIRHEDANTVIGKITKRGIDAVKAMIGTSSHESPSGPRETGGIGWKAVADATDESETGATSGEALQDLVAVKHKALLQAYKAEGLARGIRITDEMVAKAASPTWHDRTPVQRWKSNDARCTPGDDRKIRAVLRDKPHLK